MNRIKLNFDGVFEIEKIEVLSKTKQGKIIGKDEKTKKPIYEEVPAVTWKTSEGNFNSETQLDKIKSCDNYFEVRTEKDYSIVKPLLKEYAIRHFKETIETASQRLVLLADTIKEVNEKKWTAAAWLDIMTEVKL